ncbi:MAG: hypothetical protein QW461_01070 [Candidatus Jordarchaeales archaeon]
MLRCPISMTAGWPLGGGVINLSVEAGSVVLTDVAPDDPATSEHEPREKPLPTRDIQKQPSKPKQTTRATTLGSMLANHTLNLPGGFKILLRSLNI